MAAATQEQIAALEANHRLWRRTLFPSYLTDPLGRLVPDAPHQNDMWDWLWAIRAGHRAPTFVALWNRGGAKSTIAEMGSAALGVTGRRNYGWYVCAKQNLADDHVGNIASMLESPRLATFYPEHADYWSGRFGARAWRRNRVRTKAGFSIDALGLDTAARGSRLEEHRPNFLIFDDVDELLDTPATVEKKLKTITQTLIPAGAADMIVLFVQNLIHENSIASQLGNGTAEYLTDRIVSGPIPGFHDLDYERKRNGKWVITRGTPTWDGFGIERGEALLNDIGPSAFEKEVQHNTEPPAGGIFSHLGDGRDSTTFLAHLRVDRHEIPDLIRAAVWVDPAVTSTDQSDAMGIQCDGLGVDGRIYRLYSWEQIATPTEALQQALLVAAEWGATKVGVETDQGGDTWESVYREAVRGLKTSGVLPDDFITPTFTQEKAGAGRGPKVHRAQQMLIAYETTDMFRHLRGTHRVLEQALWRFPKTPPLDLVDACYWAWDDLANSEIAGSRHEDRKAITAATTAPRRETW